MEVKPEPASGEPTAGLRGAAVPILLVDDRPGDLLAMEEVLASPEYELETARSGKDAVRALERKDFAVVLLDLRMPEMDGFETALRMKRVARPGGPVPIIFVTGADSDHSHIVRAYRGGAVDFVHKPIEPEILRSKVSIFAELYRARRRLFDRLEALTVLAIALSEARAPDEVAGVVVGRGKEVAQADSCTLHVLDEEGSSLHLIGHRGVAPEIVDRIRRITETSGNPRAFADVRSGRSTWAETADDYARIFPELAATKAAGKRAQAFWSVPLVAEGRAVGLLGMGFYRARGFPAEERSFIETLAKQCAQALVRALRLDREEQAHARLATTLLSIGDAVIATDTAGHVVLMNNVAERLTGWEAGEASGRPLDDVFAIFSEETGAPCRSPIDRALAEGAVVGLANHTVLRAKSGGEIPIADSVAPIRDARGNLFGAVLVFRDASAEKRSLMQRDFLARAGAALVSSIDYRATLATVARFAVPQFADWCVVHILEPGAHAPQQVAVAHVDPRKAEWARELGEKYPLDPNAAMGAPRVIRTGEPELYPEIAPALLERVARDAEHLRLVRELKLESAMVVPLRGRQRTLGAITFVYASSGRRYTEDDLAFAEEFARRAAMAIENALALKQAEEARAEERALRAEADVANRAKDEFLATVSHELRTPLNAILGWTVTLRSRNPPPDVDRGLAIVERNARRQLRLVEDVLDVSRIISGKLSLTLGPTNVSEVVGNAVESVLPAAEAKGVKVEADLAADSSTTMTGDSDRLQQVMWNLLMNAVKFSAKGGKVVVKAFRQGSDVCVSVTDSGVGIPADVLPYVFEPFRQADASTTRIHGGLGLGLAIVKQLVVAHGGTVQAQSEGQGRGATFVVCLPVRGAVPAVHGMPASASLPSMAAVRAPRLDGLNVLVVDDEEDALLVIEEVLRFHGASVTLARSADAALEAFESVRPDVVVSDVGMPEVDGYGLLRRIRALPASRGGRTPAIALTAYARREDAQRAFAAGFQMHVPKPVEPAQLATMVANLGGRTLE